MKYSPEEVNYYKDVYVAAVKAGSPPDRAHMYALKALKQLKTIENNSLDKYSKEEIHNIKSKPLNNKESAIDIIKSVDNGR